MVLGAGFFPLLAFIAETDEAFFGKAQHRPFPLKWNSLTSLFFQKRDDESSRRNCVIVEEEKGVEVRAWVGVAAACAKG